MLKINEVTRLYLGIQGENLAQEITIDVSPWITTYPNGSVTIWHKRNGDAVPQPTGAVFDPDEKVVRWSPTATDTYMAGEGVAEIRLTESNVIKKSKIIITGVSKAVTGADGNEFGSGWQDYIDAVERAAGVAIIKNGQIRFHIDDNGHLIFSYTNEVPVAEEDESNE